MSSEGQGTGSRAKSLQLKALPARGEGSRAEAQPGSNPSVPASNVQTPERFKTAASQSSDTQGSEIQEVPLADPPAAAISTPRAGLQDPKHANGEGRGAEKPGAEKVGAEKVGAEKVGAEKVEAEKVEAEEQEAEEKKKETLLKQPSEAEILKLWNAIASTPHLGAPVAPAKRNQVVPDQDGSPQDSGNFQFGHLQFDKGSKVAPATYAKIPCPKDGGMNAHLLRFMAERVWKLNRPDLLISVTGGAKDFDLTLNQKDKLLQGLMSVAKHLDVWFVTGGCSEGIMKYVGEARAKYAVHVPLIGVAVWGVVTGQRLFENDDFRKEEGSSVVMYDRASQDHERKQQEAIQNCTACQSRKGCELCNQKHTTLDHNHTHFFLVDDGSTGKYGGEVATRTNFEFAVSGANNFNRDIVKAIKRQLPNSGDEMQSATGGVNLNTEKTVHGAEIPSVCVCVQGGPGSCQTVLDTAKKGTPVFLVKGSGKAADLISDLVMLSFSRGDWKYLRESSMSKNQDELSKFLQAMQEVYQLDIVQIKSSKDEDKDKDEQADKAKQTDQNKEGKAGVDIHHQAVMSNENASEDQWRTNFDAFHQMLGKLIPPDKKKAYPGYENITESITTLTKKFDLAVGQTSILRKALECMDRTYRAYYSEKKPRPVPEIARILIQAMQAAMTNMCWVYDLDNTDPQAYDFCGSLLRCLIHGMGREHQVKQKDDGRQTQTLTELQSNTLHKKLLLSIKFDRTDLLDNTLQNTKLTRGKEAYNSALNRAMEYALMHGRVAHVKVLMDNGASVDQFHFVDADSRDEGVVRGKEQKWKKLISAYKSDPALHHLMDMVQSSKYPHSLMRFMSSSKKVTSGQDGRKLPMRQRLAVVYKNILGPEFRYEMGMLGPYIDLLLWSGLMNRPDMAELFWSVCSFPVRSALTMCILFRRMSKRADIEPVIKAQMKQSAELFERKALGVQMAALEEDMARALEAIEAPMALWDSMTTLDLAIYGECEEFLEGCCTEALDRRFAGDLNPYSQQLGPLKGLKTCCCFHMITLGFFAPLVMKYVAPPKANNLRFPTQRRKVPDGFPLDVADNKILSRNPSKFPQRTQKWIHKLAVDRRKTEQVLGNDALNELWAPTFGYWEKYYLFWTSPVTIFIANATAQIAAVVFFTIWLIRDYNETKVEAWDYAFLGYFSSAILLELVQMAINNDYVYEVWNWLDLAAIAIYYAGFFVKLSCQENALDCTARLWTASLPIEGLPKLYYSICLCFLYIRLLRCFSVHKDLGPLVLVVFQMADDVKKFGLIFFIYLMAFSILIRGSGTNIVDDDCIGDEGMDSVVSCARDSWWIVRTFFQSLGEPFVEDMQTDAAIISLMILWVVMNVLLLNLLIAIMSNTYEEARVQSNRKFLVDLYSVTKDYTRVTLSVPLPFSIVTAFNDLLWYGWHSWKGRIKYMYPESSFGARLDRYLSRNQKISRLGGIEMEKKAYDKPSQRSKSTELQKKLEAKYETELDAFMENSKGAYLERSQLTQVSAENLILKLQSIVHQRTEVLEKRLEDILREVSFDEQQKKAEGQGGKGSGGLHTPKNPKS